MIGRVILVVSFSFLLSSVLVLIAGSTFADSAELAAAARVVADLNLTRAACLAVCAAAYKYIVEVRQ